MLSFLLCSPFLVPLSDPTHWHQPSFDDRKKTIVSYEPEGLVIKVEDSASPLFFKLPETMNVSSLSVDGVISGFPRLGESTEGEGSGDDFALRIGLVSPGERPGWLKRLFLPRWIKALLALDSETGFSEVHFYNVSQKLAVGESREHPKLGNVYEEMMLQMKTPGAFGVKKDLTTPTSTFALWIQSDGDDSHSTFVVKLRRLSLCNKP